jgi:predicted nucleic acid-binding protein
MNINITSFNILNVIDTCAIDNLLSSNTLYTASLNANCKFCYTKFVEYEMFFKERKNSNTGSLHIQNRLKDETKLKRFECHELSIDDLQDVEIMEKRKKLGIGELSSIAFARKINQSFMSDDQGARKLATEIIGKNRVQTTPHLLGWLFYNRELIDSDFKVIIQEHESKNRTLSRFLNEAYDESLRIRMMENN